MDQPDSRDEPCAPRPTWLQDLGLRPARGWLADPRLGLALLAGVVFWLALAWWGEPRPVYGLVALVSLVLLQPVVEELLFRGLLQGWLLTRTQGRRQFAGITLANLTVSILFTALHFINHPALWAAGVLFPSLLFGYFRDRHGSVYPAIALHVFYNAGYFLLPMF